LTSLPPPIPEPAPRDCAPGEADLRALSPHFLWLLRDHYLQLKGSGGEWVSGVLLRAAQAGARGGMGEHGAHCMQLCRLVPERVVVQT